MNDLLPSETTFGRVEAIKHIVAADYGVSLLDLDSTHRAQSIVQARFAAIWLARRLTTHSLPAIGRFFGRRDHTTILHAINKVDEAREADADYRVRIDALRFRCEQLLAPLKPATGWVIDAVEVAHKIANGGARTAINATVLEIGATARRLLDLEEVAAGTYQLLANADRIEQLRGTAEAAPLIAQNQALIATLASALHALGYEQETADVQEEQKAGDAAVHAAAVAE